jgi:predicted nuclease of restriction endonuclease-like RecB superfamily
MRSKPAFSSDLQSKTLEVSKGYLESVISALGPNRACYYLLLKTVSDENNSIKISLQACAKLFNIATIKGAQSILSELEANKVIKVIAQPDPKRRLPTQYKLEL